MDMKKGEGHWENWYEIHAPSPKVLEYIRHTVPVNHRSFDREAMVWRVHMKFIDGVRQLMNSSNVPTPDDPYAVLHLRPTAPPAIIKAVWKELAKELHPDRGGDVEQFKKVNEAYQKISKG